MRDMGVLEDKIVPEGTIQPKPKSPVKGPRRKEVVRNITVLDLFSGTGSVTKALSGLGYTIITLDSDRKWDAEFCVDILSWDYKRIFPVGYFDVIFASPPCTHFSKAKTVGFRNLDSADALVQKTLEIIQYFQPKKWFLENPRDGLLQKRPYMEGIPFIDVDYCQFSNWGYCKPTRVWGGNIFPS